MPAVVSTCHIDAAPFSAKALRNLVKIINKQEALIEKALNISEARKARWCKGIDQEFLAKIERKRDLTLDDINEAWYGRKNHSPSHYDRSRYQALNLHNVWFRSTVEFRFFEGTLHAGKVKSYLQFCLALAAKALSAKGHQQQETDIQLGIIQIRFPRVFCSTSDS